MMALKVQLAQQDQRAIQVQLVQLVQRAIQAQQVQLDYKVQPENLHSN